MQLNYPWSELGIHETNDKRAIKKAYAKLLRKYRPDEYPEKFQEINQAYQYALSLTHNNFSEKANPVTPASSDSAETISESIEETDSLNGFDAYESSSNLNDLEDKMSSELTDNSADTQLVENILEQFHQTAFAEYRVKKQTSSWHFLDSYHDIQDLSLRDQLSKELFKRVVEYNQFQYRENSTLLLNQPMVKSISEHLSWDEHWQELQRFFPSEYSQHVFDLLKSIDTTRRSANLISRAFSVYMEIVVINFFVRYVGWHEIDFPKEITILLIFIITSTLATLTKLNIPVVQYFFELRLFDHYVNTPSIKQKITRLILFYFSLIPVVTVFVDEVNFSPWNELIASVIVIINMICWIKNKQFFHDWASKTILLK